MGERKLQFRGRSIIGMEHQHQSLLLDVINWSILDIVRDIACDSMWIDVLRI